MSDENTDNSEKGTRGSEDFLEGTIMSLSLQSLEGEMYEILDKQSNLLTGHGDLIRNLVAAPNIKELKTLSDSLGDLMKLYIKESIAVMDRLNLIADNLQHKADILKGNLDNSEFN